MNVAAIVQARLGSSRLPRKVFADVAGKTLLARVVERTRAVAQLDEVVVATTDRPDDDELARYVTDELNCPVFRGAESDVLDRFYQCATTFKATVVVRVTADDPLKDPEIIGRALGLLIQDPSLDYVSNTLKPTFPEGLDIEVFRYSALARAWSEAKLASEREHVTPYIWKNQELFRTVNFVHDSDLSSWRWTVDKPADLVFMQTVFGQFKDDPLVSYRTVIEWLRTRPSVLTINSDTARNEGYLKSLESEK